MAITITGLHVGVGSTLSEYVHKGIEKLGDKYALHFLDAHVRFQKKGPLSVAEIEATLGGHTEKKSHHEKASGEAEDFYVAFDAALSTLQRSVAKHKKHLVDAHKGRTDHHSLETRDHVLSAAVIDTSIT